MGKNDKDIDDFWDIESIMPKRLAASTYPDTEPVGVTFGKDEEQEKEIIPKKSQSERHKKAETIIKSFEKKENDVITEYKPSNAYFVNVRICTWPTPYTFYDRFVTDAMKYVNAKISECEFVSYFSYMPQFNQLTLSQLHYYLWWRKNLRQRVYLKTAYSYILLYLYELINLEDVGTPEGRLYDMCDVWLAYRKAFPIIDKYIGEWVCDFCLIYKLDVPKEIKPIIPQILSTVTLKEFYSASEPADKQAELEMFILKQTEYNYKNSSVYGEKNKLLFDSHIIPCALYALEKTKSSRLYSSTPKLTRIVRDAYGGALCICKVKKKIHIEYFSHMNLSRPKPIITSLIKYCENKIREYLGVKSRLSTKDLTPELKAAADEYFSVHLPKKQLCSPELEAEKIRYKFYDSTEGELSLEDAFKIENDSWETTKALVDAEEVEDEPIFENIFESDESDDVYKIFLDSLDELKYTVLKLLYDGDEYEAKRLCKEKNVLMTTLIDEINSLCFDITGDIIIQELEIIGDYRDELKFK